MFRTSWRTVLREAAWIALGVSVGLVVLFLVNGDPLGDVLWLCGVAWVGSFAFYAIHYRLLGVAFVEVMPDAVLAKQLGGPEIRIARDELSEAWVEQKWRLTGAGRRITVREIGFTTDEWIALSFALRDWKDAGPVEALPGVLARPQDQSEAPEVAVYEAQHSPALWWGPPFFALVAVGTFLASLPSYRDGTWLEEPMLTLFCPLAGAGFVVLFALALPRLVRRATFLPETLVIERFVGKHRIVPYGDLLDVHGKQIVTRRGRFVLGERNAGAFLRLLDPHLDEGQLSGEMGLRFAFEMHYLLYGLGAGIVLGFLASIFLPSMFGLPNGWASVVFFVVFIGCMSAAALVARTMSRRDPNHLVDS